MISTDISMDARLQLFKQFLADSDEYEMYLSGPGGCGKTYSVKSFVEYLREAEIPYLLVAYTHDACKVLRENVYPDEPRGVEAMTNIRTLHSFLKKMPGINVSARRREQLKCVLKGGKPETPKVLILDEYSMIGDNDYMDIGELVADDTGKILMKTMYVGDNSQLPPVGQAQVIAPRGNYQILLTKNMRLDAASQSIDPVLGALREMIKTSIIQSLPESSLVHRNTDIVQQYVELVKSGVDPDEIRVLAYRNVTVYNLNLAIHAALDNDFSEYEPGDVLFDSTLKEKVVFKPFGLSTFLEDYKSVCKANKISKLRTNGKTSINVDDKYNTMGRLQQEYDAYIIDDSAARVSGVSGRQVKYYVPGYVQWSILKDTLEQKALDANTTALKYFENSIVSTYPDAPKNASEKDIFVWLNKNCYNMEPVEDRRTAWSQYLLFSNFVSCLDRPYASTVHKVQGKSYDYVLLDGADMLTLYRRNKEEYLKLFYTAVSRARKEIWINN